MHSMFYGCKSLTSIDVTKFNTEKVEIMCSMFSYCESLTSIYVSNNNINKFINNDVANKNLLKLK